MDFEHEIDASGIDNGEPVTTEAVVREYFTVENYRQMFGQCDLTQQQLDDVAAHYCRTRLS
ncbi:MAG TPA: hypothetical protein VM238_18545 [Phycisphaerae bacterium]|nr:hypothetical protein [Phycisphaerae bacterium]